MSDSKDNPELDAVKTAVYEINKSSSHELFMVQPLELLLFIYWYLHNCPQNPGLTPTISEAGRILRKFEKHCGSRVEIAVLRKTLFDRKWVQKMEVGVPLTHLSPTKRGIFILQGWGVLDEIDNRTTKTGKILLDLVQEEAENVKEDLDKEARGNSLHSQKRRNLDTDLPTDDFDEIDDLPNSTLNSRNLERVHSLTRTFDGVLDRDFVSQTLRTLRKEKGLTQAQTAQLVGVSQTDIARIERGKATVDKGLEVLERLGLVLLVKLVEADSLKNTPPI